MKNEALYVHSSTRFLIETGIRFDELADWIELGAGRCDFVFFLLISDIRGFLSHPFEVFALNYRSDQRFRESVR